MKRVRRTLGRAYIRMYFFLKLLGIDLHRMRRFLGGLPWYMHDLRILKSQQQTSLSSIPLGQYFPTLEDKNSAGGSARGHYFFQDLLVAQRIFTIKPELHVDIGSRIDGFVAHVASFRTIEVLDIRPVEINLPNIRFRQGNLMADLDAGLIDYCDSLSCLHALEHFGLGRYGDPINIDGHLKGFDNFYRILRQGGKLFFSVPFGQERIEFNAHRVFSMHTLLELIGTRYQIDRFCYVDDSGALFADVELTSERISDSFGCNFGCAIFELTKL